MHMAMVIGGGVVLLGLFLLFGKLWGGAQPDYGLAAKLFVPAWLAVTLVNMWVGSPRQATPCARNCRSSFWSSPCRPCSLC